jgi:hypothetical protein
MTWPFGDSTQKNISAHELKRKIEPELAQHFYDDKRKHVVALLAPFMDKDSSTEREAGIKPEELKTALDHAKRNPSTYHLSDKDIEKVEDIVSKHF